MTFEMDYPDVLSYIDGECRTAVDCPLAFCHECDGTEVVGDSPHMTQRATVLRQMIEIAQTDAEFDRLAQQALRILSWVDSPWLNLSAAEAKYVQELIDVETYDTSTESQLIQHLLTIT